MNNIDDILAKHFSGETSPKEEQEVLSWKTENKAEYETLKSLWLLPSEAQEFPVFNKSMAWDKVAIQLHSHDVKKSFKLHWIGAAASIALLVGAFLFMNKTETVVLANKSTTSEKYSLPDGSEIWLAANSQVTFKEDFKENRNLELTGTAFFEVNRDEDHPFKIQHAFGEVEVLGTGFNVAVNESGTSVNVAHGKVAVRNKKGDELILETSQGAIVDVTAIIPAKKENTNAFSWKTGKFNFEDTDLNEVIRLLNAHFEKKIELSKTLISDELPHLTATFENQSIEEIIEIIVLTCGVKAEYNENTILLK